MDTGTKIRILREGKNVSREVMADILKMSVNTFKKIESGERTPDIDEIKIIANKLDIDPMFFLKNDSVYITNGNNSPGGGQGNVVTMDKSLLKVLTKTLDNLNRFLQK